MAGMAAVLYGMTVYILSMGVLAYAIGFVADLPLPKTINSGAGGPWLACAAIDLALLGAFGMQHSVMARPAFKRWWTRFVPPPVERSTFLLFSSLALALLFWQWRPIPMLAWRVTDPFAAFALQAVSWTGWALVVFSTFLISHFELFGLQQVFGRLFGRPPTAPAFRTPSLYKVVRHPLYLGFILAFWATPAMTAGHLLFAVAATGYIVIGALLEERDLVTNFGDRYRNYRREVPMLLPLTSRHASKVNAGPSS